MHLTPPSLHQARAVAQQTQHALALAALELPPDAQAANDLQAWLAALPELLESIEQSPQPAWESLFGDPETLVSMLPPLLWGGVGLRDDDPNRLQWTPSLATAKRA